MIEKTIETLVKEYQKMQGQSKPISPTFIKYLASYTEPTKPDEYEKTGADTAMYEKLLYIIRTLSKLKKPERKRMNNVNLDTYLKDIKKGALGFNIKFFNQNIYSLKNDLDLHYYEIIFQIYQNMLIYRKLKGVTVFSTKTHANFFEIVKDELREYENAVVSADLSKGLLGFYLSLWKVYMRLQFVNQMNECFREGPKNPFKFLQMYGTGFNSIIKSQNKSSNLHDAIEVMSENCYKNDDKLQNIPIMTMDNFNSVNSVERVISYPINNYVCEKCKYMTSQYYENRCEKINNDNNFNVIKNPFQFIYCNQCLNNKYIAPENNKFFENKNSNELDTDETMILHQKCGFLSQHANKVHFAQIKKHKEKNTSYNLL
ncbi:hypothetical protein EDEG_03012 [Edhazardia aedis USNM 41457]|uniref:Uncharacterized protein n=1 Tax=Edhazardia aedis (strain USNM 41457) TaxID=1003232 RepID=J9DJ23_EDHAE|nr:hypothetical protein EDEG_03012 [Edhazardia aedis USNM 41457]|eukprot:EJW02590.1 hypothetical protein EDEG_03012 [Edhazardia aedis USNM 41457]